MVTYWTAALPIWGQLLRSSYYINKWPLNVERSKTVKYVLSNLWFHSLEYCTANDIHDKCSNDRLYYIYDL